MSDEIRDLDDVEAQAWALAWAHSGCSPKAADECVRLLRERRAPAEDKVARMGSEWSASVGAERERAAIVAWLRGEGEQAEAKFGHDYLQAAVISAAIERGEHER